MAKKRKVTPDLSPTALAELIPPHARFISKHQVLDRVPVSFPALWEWIRDGKFPAPREVAGGGKAMWLESEVEDWIKSRPKKTYKSRELSA
jgi:predicted DNA-binding transcriptional regulator AlpA